MKEGCCSVLVHRVVVCSFDGGEQLLRLQHSGISRGVGGVVWEGADEHWPAERVAANDNDCDCDAAVHRPQHDLVALESRAAVAR